VSAERLVHHELCFGCGRTNMFGLLMELEQAGEGTIRGRGFIKQDHQGPVRGTAHPGVVTAALTEAIAFAAQREAEIDALEIHLRAPVPIGAFIDVEAHAADRAVTGTAWVEEHEVASARAAYRG
jgi:acyl-coenzyme A thioesterase PaaI-like protein